MGFFDAAIERRALAQQVAADDITVTRGGRINVVGTESQWVIRESTVEGMVTLRQSIPQGDGTHRTVKNYGYNVEATPAAIAQRLREVVA